MILFLWVSAIGALLFPGPNDFLRGLFCLFIIALVVTFFMIGEMRWRMVSLEMERGELVVSTFYGLGPKYIFRYSEFEGFHCGKGFSRRGDYEYLYLVRNGQPDYALSQLYHRNYAELKASIMQEIPFLGFKSLGVLARFRRMFGRRSL